MNPPLSQDEALTQLKLYTSQTGNFTFTDDEMSQSIEQAWNDPYVVDFVWDSSLTYSDGTWQYAVPDSVTVVRGLYYQNDTDSNPRRISSDCYEVVAGNIQFNNKIRRWMTTGQTIYVKGQYKLSSDDDLDTIQLVNYVINLAAEILLTKLILKASFVFLKNDTTISDIVRALQVVQGNVLRYKQAILREFEDS